MSVQGAVHKGCSLFHWCCNQVQFETEAGEMSHGRPADVLSGGVQCRSSMLIGQPLRHGYEPSPLRCYFAPWIPPGAIGCWDSIFVSLWGRPSGNVVPHQCHLPMILSTLVVLNCRQFCSPGGCLSMSGHAFGHHTWVRGSTDNKRVEARNAAKHPTENATALLPTKSNLRQNVKSTVVNMP